MLEALAGLPLSEVLEHALSLFVLTVGIALVWVVGYLLLWALLNVAGRVTQAREALNSWFKRARSPKLSAKSSRRSD